MTVEQPTTKNDHVVPIPKYTFNQLISPLPHGSVIVMGFDDCTMSMTFDDLISHVGFLRENLDKASRALKEATKAQVSAFGLDSLPDGFVFRNRGE